MEPAYLDALSDDLLRNVVAQRCLLLEDLCRLQRVSKRLRRVVCDSQVVWRQLYESTFGAGSQPAGGGSGGSGGQRAAATEPKGQGWLDGLPPPVAASSTHQVAASSNYLPSSSGRPPQDAAQQPGRPGAAQHRGGGSSGGGVDAAAASPPAGSKRKRTDAEQPAAAAVAAEEVCDWQERFKSRFMEESRRLRLKRQARRLKAESALQFLQREVHRLEQALEREQQELPPLQAQLAAVRQARRQATAAALAQTYWQPVAVQQAHGVVTAQAPHDAEGWEQDLQQRVAVAQLEIRKLKAALAARRQRAADARSKLQALLP